MPDFEVNEGYVEAGRRRADSPLPGLRADERAPADGHLSADGPSSVEGYLSVDGPSSVEGYLSADGHLSVEGYLSADGHPSVEGYPSVDGCGATIGDILGEGTERTETGGEPRKLPEVTPIVRRTRHLAVGHFTASGAVSGRRVGVRLVARRRRLARRACPYGWQVRVLGTPPRNRRRLWTQCLRSR